ncbi:melA, partial [Symbiodinium pilosum]
MAGMLLLLFAALTASPSAAIDNGLGRTPPMGWRSWNLYGRNITQNVIQNIMDGVVSKKRSVDGVPTSLCDLGYCDVGVDEGWAYCPGGHKYMYHDDSGKPIVDVSKFPNMTAMVAHAHKLGLTAGWYGNVCGLCKESQVTDAMYAGDVAALTAFGFDAVKLDGCGKELDLDKWASLLNKTGRPVMIENCHWGKTVPTPEWCPWNFF